MLDWQAFDEVNKTWSEIKTHFAEAYEIRLQSGTGGGNTYHGAANTYKGVDDDIMGTITQSIANMQHDNNTNT